MRADTANVYYDHPYHAPLDHALGIDFICEADGGRERVAVGISRESALELIETIKAAVGVVIDIGGIDPHQAAGQRQGTERLDAGGYRECLLRPPLSRAARPRARHRLYLRSRWRARAGRRGDFAGVGAGADRDDQGGA